MHIRRKEEPQRVDPGAAASIDVVQMEDSEQTRVWRGIKTLSLGSFKAGAIFLLLFPTADAAQSSSIMLTLGDTVIPGVFVALALCIALPRHSRNHFFSCAFLRYTSGLTVAIIIMNWFQAQPAVLYVALGVIGLIITHWLWNGEVKWFFLACWKDNTNQPMGKVWNWNMYGTKLKKFDGWVFRTTNEDGNSGEHDATVQPKDREGGPEDGFSGEEDAGAPLEDHGYSEEDAAAPLGKDDDGDQDDRGAPLKDSGDDIVPLGQHVVQVLSIRANFRVHAIYAYDWEIGSRCIYREHEGEVQEERMVDLVPFGPSDVLIAEEIFTLEILHYITRDGNEGIKDYVCTVPLRMDWDIRCDDGNDEPEEYAQTIFCRSPNRKLEITFLVIPNAIETNVEVKLKLKDLHSRSRAVYGHIKASTADYGNKSVHLFSCESRRSWFVPSGPTSILPLRPAVIAVPYRRLLELHIEVDLIVITIFDNQEEHKNLKFRLTFTRGVRSQEREVDGDLAEVSIAFYPKI